LASLRRAPLLLSPQRGYDEALVVLNELKMKGKVYAEALLIEAHILRIQNKLDQALKNLTILGRIAPEEPGLLFNYCSFYLQKNDLKQAAPI